MVDFNEGRVKTAFLETVSFRLSHHYLLHCHCAHYQYLYHVAPLPHVNSSQNFINFYRYTSLDPQNLRNIIKKGGNISIIQILMSNLYVKTTVFCYFFAAF